ncbi:MAG: acylphosphatase [Anaerovibrio sp.]|uniref:acylphosphatase n=1 Tax=Anaerovibrio sp. TaxID=1872532 RepID=UPI0025EB55E0|nr:acylphosphatase [Anaerovibrio sp.]MCR5176196.1 acylphosphatase [Anaerovibrio sp.]
MVAVFIDHTKFIRFSIRLLLLLAITCMPGSGSCQAASGPVGARVEVVSAEVYGNIHIPTDVKVRMEKSVQAIGVQLLEGHTVQEVKQRKTHYEDIIRQVFDKVLVGYTVEGASITADSSLKISVKLLSWNDRIDKLSVETKIIGMPEEVEKLLMKDISGIDTLFDDLLLDLPVAAVDWSNGVVKHRLNEFMAKRAPEFRADFELSVDEDTKVFIDIYPLLPVVRTVDLSMRSDTLPNAALLTQRQNMQDGADMFVGVPVAFVSRHQDVIQQLLERRVDDTSGARSWGVHTTVTIIPKERMGVMSRSNSDKYFLRFEGRAEIGHSRDDRENDSGVMVRGIVGKQFNNGDGVFTLLDFFPQHAHWNWDIGYYRDLLPGLRGHVRYDIKDKYWKGALQYDLTGRWSVLYEYREKNSINEIALRYKLHDFLSVECAMDNHDKWLRFIGYF